MQYLEEIRSGHDNPKLLENLYHTAQQESNSAELAADLLSCYQDAPITCYTLPGTIACSKWKTKRTAEASTGSWPFLWQS